MMAWRLLDLSESDGEKIDLVIATKFPTYAVEHHNKVLWMVHQYRIMYDLAFSEFDGYHCNPKVSENTLKIRKEIKEIEEIFLKECIQPIYSISQTVKERLKKFNLVESILLYPPAPFGENIAIGEYGDYILHVGRLDKIKRIDLLIRAFAKTKNGKLVITGKGSEYNYLFNLIQELKIEDRCTMIGFLNESDLVEYIANARAIYYSPHDEDYGYATIEAFLAKKPIITCWDSGEVAKIVNFTKAGLISDNNLENIVINLIKVFDMKEKELESMGEKGYAFAKKISWENVIQKLVLDNLK
jgi:glycosyltransferase involved in cell wall biosynthesis